MKSRRLVKTLVSVSLALLVAFLSLLQLPQLALSYTYSSVTSTFKEHKQIQTNKSHAQASKTSFPDIQGHWAQAYIEALSTRDIIAGYPDGNYRPENLVTRAEFAAIINKAFSPAPERSSSDFADVPVNFWGYQGIQTAYRGGFLEGYPGRVFQPKQHIPRVQVLVSLSTGLKLRSKKTELLSYYSDASEIPEYATQAVAGATERQLVVNYPNLTQLNPNREATRAEVAAFVYQALVNAGKANPIASSYVVNPSSEGNDSAEITDSDRDGLPNEREGSLGTNPNNPDTDGDGKNDGLEVAQGTDPTAPNSPDINVVHSDRDGLPDKQEQVLGTNPNNSDTDRDGTNDGAEVAQRTDSNNSNPTAKLPPETPNSKPTQPGNDPNPIPPIGSKPTQPGNNHNPIPPGGASSNGITVKITNSEQVDGTPYTIGQKASLIAEARDQRGTDLSAQIEWLTVEGILIGRGSNLNYDSASPDSKIGKNETITARMKTLDGREAFDRVSFTVSPSDVILAPNVKVLKDEAQKNLVDLDLRTIGKICLINDRNLPTIKPGNVILGAGGIIPPLKVLRIESQQNNLLCLRTEFAPLEEVFRETKHPFPITSDGKPKKLSYNSNDSKWVDFNPSGNKPDMKTKWTDYLIDCNRKGYTYRYNKYKRNDIDTSNTDGLYKPERDFPSPAEIIPDPSRQYLFNLFSKKQASDKVKLEDRNKAGRFTISTRAREEYNIEANAYLGYEFEPEVFGDIGFSIDKGLKLKFNAGANETLIGGITLEALYKYAEQYKKTLASLEGLEAPRTEFFIGPIPVWIDFPLFLDFEWNSNFQAELKKGVFGFLQTAYFDFGFKYNWDKDGFEPTSNGDSLSALMACGEVDLTGSTRPALIPRVQFLLYSVAGPQLGLEGYVSGEFTRPERIVNISQPAPNATFNQTTPINLQAQLGQASNLPIQVGAGFNLNGQMLAANRLLFPPYKLEILGKKCLEVGIGNWKRKWCTDPVVVEFDVNRWFKDKTSFEVKLKRKQKDIAAPIPFSVEPFEQLTGVPMEDATVVWQADGSSTLGISNPGSSGTIEVGSLPVGTHNIKATVYAPLDTNLERALGSSSVNINIK